VQSSSQIVTTNKPTFYRPDALPVAQPTVSKRQSKNNSDRLMITNLYQMPLTTRWYQFLVDFQKASVVWRVIIATSVQTSLKV